VEEIPAGHSGQERPHWSLKADDRHARLLSLAKCPVLPESFPRTSAWQARIGDLCWYLVPQPQLLPSVLGTLINCFTIRPISSHTQQA
jgi:hypothetical protein